MRDWTLGDWYESVVIIQVWMMRQRTHGLGLAGLGSCTFRTSSFLCDVNCLQQPGLGEGFPVKSKIIRKPLSHLTRGLMEQVVGGKREILFMCIF